MKILYVEDVPKINQVFEDNLATKNYDFDSVSDSSVGLELAALFHFGDLIT